MRSFKEFLTEFPNVLVPTVFDLELETKKTLEDLQLFLKRIFSGKPIKDKHGNVLSVKNQEQKNLLKKSIFNDEDIRTHLKFKYKETLSDFKKFINKI